MVIRDARSRTGEKWGWIGGWIGSTLWIFALSIVWLFQGKTFHGVLGVVLFLLAMVLMLSIAPWRLPKTRYWKLMLPLFACLGLSVILALDAFLPGSGWESVPWYSWFWILFLVLPVIQIGNRTWE